jgi:hypothetical protein
MSQFKTAVKAKLAQARRSQTPALTLAKIIKSETFGKETASIRAQLMQVLKDGAPWLHNSRLAIALVIDGDSQVKYQFEQVGRSLFRTEKQNDRIADVKAGKFLPHSTTPVKRARKAKPAPEPTVIHSTQTGLLTPIEDVTLSTRASNLLQAWEIRTVQEARARIAELKGVKGCGPKTYEELAAL